MLPDRLQPYREFTIIYHEIFRCTQAFPNLYAYHRPTWAARADNFGINYGIGGIVSEILANRLGVGPGEGLHECKYEEFFLSSWAVGDPAMIVDIPATACVDPNNQPIPGCKATVARFPDDPSNVYHSYIGDHTSSACCTAARTCTTSTTSTRTSGCTRPTARTATTPTASRSAPARRSPWRWSTTAAAT